MMSHQTPGRATFPGLSSASFEHPLDRAALEALRKVPGVDSLFRKFSSLGYERQVRLHFTADSLRLSPRQRPDLYQLLTESAEVLDMPAPELYLLQSPFPNAFAIGMDRHTVVMTSALVELLDRDETRAVVAHELGHIKSGHMLYRTIAIFLSVLGLNAARNLPIVNLLSQALRYALYDWCRKSELTADRAGLLVAQDPAVSVSTLLKLAGGPRGPVDDASRAEFLKQADDYEDMDASLLNILYKFEMTRFQTHPFPAVRAREISDWATSSEYREILSGSYSSSSTQPRRCPSCGQAVTQAAFAFCPDCGAAMR